MDTKRCRGCGEVKPLDQFWKNRSQCKACEKPKQKKAYEKNRQREIDRAKAWRRANPERTLETQRKHREENRERIALEHFAYRFGLTKEEAVKVLAKKGGPCPICKVREALEYDHDHATGVNRGWLCGSCNRGLGLFGDDVSRLKAAVRWVQKGGE